MFSWLLQLFLPTLHSHRDLNILHGFWKDGLIIAFHECKTHTNFKTLG